MLHLRILLGPLLAFALIPFDLARADEGKVRNVLFIVSDDLRASALGCYGNDLCQTPNIDRLAKRGMLFERAYCQGTWCAPSRVSFMYSRYQGTGKLPLGQFLIQHDFYSARVGKIFHMRVPGDIIDGTHGKDVAACWTERFNSSGKEAHTPGDYACLNRNVFTDKLEGRESTGMKNRAFVTVSYDGDGSDQPDHKTATKIIELLQQQQNGKKPFFIAAGLVRPHYPMVAPRRFFSPYSVEKIRLPPQVEGDLDDIPEPGRTSTSKSTGIDQYPENQKRMWSGYYASVQFMDEQVGRILDEVDRLGLSDSTAIIFTSDHGYQLGDHTFWQKLTLHEHVVRVPLIIALPGHKPGRTRSFAELVDIYPTVAASVGLDVHGDVQGCSLLPVIKDSTTTVKTGTLSFHNGALWRTDRWAYMRYHDGSEELYDMKLDPVQITNLVGSESHAETLRMLRKQWKERTDLFGLKFRMKNQKRKQPIPADQRK